MDEIEQRISLFYFYCKLVVAWQCHQLLPFFCDVVLVDGECASLQAEFWAEDLVNLGVSSPD